MHLYKLEETALLKIGNEVFHIPEPWDTLLNQEDLHSYLSRIAHNGSPLAGQQADAILQGAQAPIGRQEVWAAGVTYLRSREARMEESKKSGGADFYDKVYEAERPELFFKSLPQRVAGPGQQVYIRRDSAWNVPEPELTLFVSANGKIQGYTVGNDMSSRSIEGENPLYLPQAKVYERSAALGPCLYVPQHKIDPDAMIVMDIFRSGVPVFADSVSINRMKRTHIDLVDYLFRECDFPHGVFLMTGTCIVPPNDFTLQEGDRVDIHISQIGTLTNQVAYKPV